VLNPNNDFKKMFRKPKRSAKKAGFRARKKTDDDDVNNDDEDDRETSQELQEVLKRAKHEHNNNKSNKSKTSSSGDDAEENDGSGTVMHQFENKTTGLGPSIKDLATSTQQHHPKEMETISKSQSLVDPTRNKFLAAPIRAPTNIRTTCRFDYQPDICKDYKDTGFCGFGDTCIYLHDRGDTMAGWQLEKVWEEKQKTKQNLKDKQIKQFLNKHNGDNFDNDNETNDDDDEDAPLAEDDDGLPFACFICREAFNEPIVTPCGHYFCQDCLQGNTNADANNDGGQKCPICSQETHGVMNQPTKLITKKRKLLGKRNSTWQEFMDASSSKSTKSGDGDDE
jgi:RING finger protein 113A